QSKGRGVGAASGSAPASAKAISPKGMLARKIHHQSATAMMAAPSEGAEASETATSRAMLPMVRPSRALGCVSRMSALETPNMEAQANPDAVRARSSIGSERDAAQASEAMMKRDKPALNTRP